MTVLMAVRASLRIPAGSGAAWTPADLGASLAAWYDASDGPTITYASTDYVSNWDDKSGNNRDAYQPTAANQPRVLSGTPNRLTFDGSNDFLAINETVSFSTTSRCVAAVAKVNSAESNNQVLIGPYGNEGFAFFLRASDNKCGIVKSNVSFFAQGPAVSADADHVFLGNLTSSTWRVSLDGTATTGTHSQTFAANRIGFIGKESLGIFFTDYDFLYGTLAELVIAGELSTGNQQKLEGYLAHRWGLSANLPGDHPYKSAAP